MEPVDGVPEPKAARRAWRLVVWIVGVLFLALALVVASLAGYDYFIGSPQPNNLVSTKAVVGTEYVRLSGDTASSALHYRGYRAQVRDGRMTVMLRWSLLHEQGGAFDIRIPTENERIREIYLSDGSELRRVYP